MKTATKYSAEVRERAMRMVQERRGEHDSQWASISAIGAKIGCTAETLRRWVRRAERDSGQRVGLSTSERERIKVLEQALHARCPLHKEILIHHSDRGVQYVSIRYTERLAEAGIEPSVGSVGDSYDNAVAETINGLYKAEVIHRRAWKNQEAVELATLDRVDWFNHCRLGAPIGHVPPPEADAIYYEQLTESAIAA